MPTHFDPDKNPEDDRFQPKPGDSHDRADGEEKDPRDDSDLADKEESSGEGGGFYKPEGDKAERDAIKSLANGATNSASSVGGLYKGSGKSRIGRMLQASLSPNARKKTVLGAGAAGGAMAIVISGMFALLPLKIVHMTTNLEKEYFGNAEDAVGKQTENLFSHYVRKHVIPSLNREGCHSTKINRNCIGDIKGNSGASRLYQGWKDARLETKLYERHGIEFEKRNNEYFMKIPRKPDTKIPASFIKNGSLEQLSDLSRSDVRAHLKNALKHETRYTRVMYRFKVGRLLERKYGIRRCIIACKLKDNFDDWKGKKTMAAKLALLERTLEPRDEMLTLVLDCYTDANGCDVNKDKDKEGRSKIERDITERLTSLNRRFGEEAVEEALNKLDNITRSGGFTKYLVEKLVTKVAGKAAGKAAGSAVPYVGVINTASSIVQMIKTAGPAYKKLSYALNIPAMVSIYTMYRTIADEQKTGIVDSEILGSFSNALGENARGDNTGVSAEASPVYQDLFSKNPNQTALFDDFLGTTAYAQENDARTKRQYLCDDGKPPQNGDLTCPEEQLQADNFVTEISAAFEQPPLNAVSAASEIWEKSAGLVFDLLEKGGEFAVEKIPGLASLLEKAPNLSDIVMDTFASKAFPSPVSDSMDGGRTFHMMAAGADASGNEFIHYGLGGKKVSDTQAAAYREERNAREYEEFKQQPFFARMFDTESRYSFTSRLAMSVPFDTASAPQNFVTSLASNPLKNVSSLFSGALGNKASARSAKDPFDIPQYLVPLNDPVFTTDPEKYDDEYCKKFNEDWLQDTVTDDESGQEIHTRTNPCLLNSAAVGSAGGYFTTNVLTPDDLSGSNNQSTTAPQQATSENLFWLGDSYTVGMKSSGGLEAKLTEKGWKPTVDASCGRPLAGTETASRCSGAPAAPAAFGAITQPENQDAIRAAGVIVMALGTNDLGGGAEKFKTNVTNMIDELRKLNSGAKIYWVNLYVGTEPIKGNVEPFNDILNDAAKSKGFTIIDWYSKAPPYYGLPDLLHPKDYNAITDTIIGSIGKAPGASQ